MRENDNATVPVPKRVPWNKGKLIGPRPPLRQKHVWAIPTTLQIEQQLRDLALFNLAIDSKLRGCDLVHIRVDDVAPSGHAVQRATVRQKKTGRPVRFELTEQTRQAVDEAVEHVRGLEPSVLGIHLEGPFLSPAKAGVHNLDMLRRPTETDLAMLTAQRNGVTLVTLAPEVVPEQFIIDLAVAGVRISLGHSMATYAQTKAAMAAGLAGFTHLFNAMRPLESREPGPIAAALKSPQAWYGLIVDGVHVSPAMLRFALRGAGHPILVTDAMPPVGGTRESFMLQGKTIVVREGRCTASDGTPAGACLDMASAVRNCVRLLDVTLPEALRFASTNTAEFLGRGHMLGKLAPRFRADMVALDGNTIEVLATWVAGRLTH